MSVIKQVSVFRNDNWQISDIGVNASNVDLSSTVALTDILPADTLTPNRALISDSSGIVTASNVTSSQLAYLTGSTVNIQNALNSLNAGLELINCHTYSVSVSNISVPSDTFTTMASTPEPLPVGDYLIVANAVFPANATGIRQVYLTTSSTGTTIANNIGDTRQAINDFKIYLRATGIVTINNVPKTLYLRCRQTSGTTLVCEGKIEVCRVK